MKKLSLLDFEYHISQTTWSLAQDMVAAGRVRNIREVERHFWVANVEDEEHFYESEVIISPTKIKAFACECWSEPRKYMCVHIAATLLQVRKFLDQRAADKAQVAQAKAAAQSEITRLSIRHVLPAVTFEDLQEFVRDYARRDPDFAQAFKTRFAEVVDGSKKAYHLLLQSVLPKSGKTMRDQDFKRLQRTLQDLGARSQKAEQDGNQGVVVRIAIAMLEVICPLLPQAVPSRKDALLDICQQSMQQLSGFYGTPQTPPELKDLIWNCWFSGAVSGLFPVELQRDIIRKMSEIAVAEPGRFKVISSQYFDGPRPLSTMFIHLYLISLAQKGVDTGPVKILQDLLASRQQTDDTENQAMVRTALLELYYTGCYDAAIQVIDFIKTTFTLSASRRTELDRIRFNIAEVTHDIPAQLGYLKQTYLHYGQQETIERMKALAGKKWPDILQELIKGISGDQSRDKVALLLANEPDNIVFTSWLDQQNDPDLTLRYQQYLPDEFLLPHLVQLMSTHLDNHFGLPAAAYVRDRLMVLAQHTRVELVRQMIKEITRLHATRSGLKDTLEEVWASLRAKRGYFI